MPFEENIPSTPLRPMIGGSLWQSRIAMKIHKDYQSYRKKPWLPAGMKARASVTASSPPKPRGKSSSGALSRTAGGPIQHCPTCRRNG